MRGDLGLQRLRTTSTPEDLGGGDPGSGVHCVEANIKEDKSRMSLYLPMGNDLPGSSDVGRWAITGMDVQSLWGTGGNGMSND